MPVDLNEQLTGQLVVLAQQGVADNQRLSMQTQLAFQKDLFQGAQGETGQLLAALNMADRTPVIKAG
jgi:uncharacterized protein YdeI (BOF family)